jgi:LacI family transcriptional regulator
MNLKQLAKELNISISTVSKALSDSHEISAKTKSAVLAKAKELNFQVNPYASGLRKQKTKTIAVVLPELVNDFFGPVLSGIESVAHEKGYHVLIYLTHEDMQREVGIIKLLRNGRVDGIMMSLSEQTCDTAHLEELKDIPLVFFDRAAEHIETPSVTTDNYNSGIRATEHLIQNGCRRIAFLSISQNLSMSRNRMNGYLEALKRNKIEKDNSLILLCSGTDQESREAIQKLLKSKDRPDGIFASVEKLANLTYELCYELDIKIPGDIKIVCFSNSQVAGLYNPSLTTIVQPAYEMGQEAATILFDMVEEKPRQSIIENTILNSKLVVRNSSKV